MDPIVDQPWHGKGLKIGKSSIQGLAPKTVEVCEELERDDMNIKALMERERNRN